MALGDMVLEGDFSLGGHDMHYASGTSLLHFPEAGTVIYKDLKDHGNSGGEKSNYSCSTSMLQVPRLWAPSLK
jgi:hypothetical protein